MVKQSVGNLKKLKPRRREIKSRVTDNGRMTVEVEREQVPEQRVGEQAVHQVVVGDLSRTSEVAVGRPAVQYQTQDAVAQITGSGISMNVDELISKTQRTLFSASAVFPFDLFPDIIRIDEYKVSVIVRDFFLIERVVSIPIKNINGVWLSTGVFFAGLSLELTGYEANPEPINYLWRQDAMKARRIIMGLIACTKEGIDISKLPLEEVINKVEEIGRTYQEVQR